MTTNPTAASWQAFDISEPVLQWQLAVPLPASPTPPHAVTPAAREALQELQAALAPIVLLSGDFFPSEDEAMAIFFDGPRHGVRFSSPVTVRDLRAAHPGVLVDVVSGNAGATLREHQPELDPAWARRFAAPVPFVQTWQATTPGRLAVTVAFYATIWFTDANTDDVEVAARNHARLVAAKAALTAVVRLRGGQLLAPLTLKG